MYLYKCIDFFTCFSSFIAKNTWTASTANSHTRVERAAPVAPYAGIQKKLRTKSTTCLLYTSRCV